MVRCGREMCVEMWLEGAGDREGLGDGSLVGEAGMRGGQREGLAGARGTGRERRG